MEIGAHNKLYGLHSLKSGGATFDVRYNPNLSERVLKLHARTVEVRYCERYVYYRRCF